MIDEDPHIVIVGGLFKAPTRVSQDRRNRQVNRD